MSGRGKDEEQKGDVGGREKGKGGTRRQGEGSGGRDVWGLSSMHVMRLFRVWSMEGVSQ